LDFSLNEDQLMLRDNMRKFCKKVLTPEYVAWLDENTDFVPDDLWQKFLDLGFFGICIPEEYGGAGMSFTDFVLVGEEIATASWTTAMCVMGPVSFGSHIIMQMGTKEQKDFFLPKIVKGELKFSLAMTEPGGGTDIINALKSTAVKKGDKWVINGQKVFITAGHVSDYHLVVALTDDSKTNKRHKCISCFLVDAKNTPGITVRLIKKVGGHGCGTTEIFYDNVEIPESALLGELNNGFMTLLEVMNPERIVTALFSLGIAKAAYQAAHQYSLERYAFGKPIGQFMAVQHYLADMMIEIENATNLIYKSCWLMEQELPYNKEAVMAKIVACKASEIAAIKGSEIFGGYGFCMEYEMQRHFRDYRQMQFSPINDEMAKNMLAGWSGLPKSY